jgi:hypothetical protein
MPTQCRRDLFGYEVVEGRQAVAAFDRENSGPALRLCEMRARRSAAPRLRSISPGAPPSEVSRPASNVIWTGLPATVTRRGKRDIIRRGRGGDACRISST